MKGISQERNWATSCTASLKFFLLLPFIPVSPHHKQAIPRHNAAFLAVVLWNLSENKNEEKCQRSLSNTALLRTRVSLKQGQPLPSAGDTLTPWVSAHTHPPRWGKNSWPFEADLVYSNFCPCRTLLSFSRLLLVTEAFWEENASPNTPPYPIPTAEKEIPEVMYSYKVHKAKGAQNKCFIHKCYICNAFRISS